MIHFEITVAGPPISSQARNRPLLAEWKQRVRKAARRSWGRRRPLRQQLQIVCVYYHDRPSITLDTDNLIKPIQDVLKTLVYHDDVQIVDAVLRKTQLDTPLRVRGISAILAQAFTEGKEFVYIKVEDPPDHAIIL